MRTYGIASLDGLGVSAEDRPAIGAAGALLRYAASSSRVGCRTSRIRPSCAARRAGRSMR